MEAHEADLSEGVTRCLINDVVGRRLRKVGSLSEDSRVGVLREYEPRLCNLPVETLLVLGYRRSR